MDGYAVNKLVQELFDPPSNAALLHGDRAALYDRYGLDDAQRAALDSGTAADLSAIGLHPILQMHFAMAANPAMAEMISVRSYLKESE